MEEIQGTAGRLLHTIVVDSHFVVVGTYYCSADRIVDCYLQEILDFGVDFVVEKKDRRMDLFVLVLQKILSSDLEMQVDWDHYNNTFLVIIRQTSVILCYECIQGMSFMDQLGNIKWKYNKL